MVTFFEKEEKLYKEWYNSYSPKEQKLFCMDGLLSSRNENPDIEADKWEKAERKILFLMKDTNGNPDDDIRCWPLGHETYSNGFPKPLHRFYVVLLKWLWALNEVSSDNLPSFNKTKEEYIELTYKYPMAQVNVKKLSGCAQVSGDVLEYFFERDYKYIREQIRCILSPNIIVCGGGSGLLCHKVIHRLYKDYSFTKVNDWCYYCSDYNLLVIDSYHPSARVSDGVKFDKMIAAVQEFYKLKQLK